MELDLSMERFRFILENQSLWAKEYREQQKEKRKSNNEKMYSKNYYGNSKEYKKLWYRTGAQVHK